MSNPDDTADTFYYAVPDETDISTEEAVRIAKQALADTYALDAGTLAENERYEERVSFVESEGDGTRQYVVEYTERFSQAKVSWLVAQVASPSGEVIQCRWWIDNALRTLPEGPLDAYRAAVEEYMAYGALAVQSADEKADIVARVKAAGRNDLITPALPYAAPGAQDITEDASI